MDQPPACHILNALMHAVLSRLTEFLPQMQAANHQLEEELLVRHAACVTNMHDHA